MAVIDQEADMVDRRPDYRGHITVLGATNDPSVDKIESIIAYVELPGAGSALPDRVKRLHKNKKYKRKLQKAEEPPKDSAKPNKTIHNSTISKQKQHLL